MLDNATEKWYHEVRYIICRAMPSTVGKVDCILTPELVGSAVVLFIEEDVLTA